MDKPQHRLSFFDRFDLAQELASFTIEDINGRTLGQTKNIAKVACIVEFERNGVV